MSNMLSVDCKNCYKKTLRYPSAIKRSKGIFFCSKPCEFEFKRENPAPPRPFKYKINSRGCWVWGKYKNKLGYGVTSYKRKLFLAHRRSWEVYVGVIPKGMLVLHSCDNPSCINPKHLFLGTHQDNMNDASRKGRLTGSYGELSGSTHLTDKEVIFIRKSMLPTKTLASKFKIALTTVYNIKYRKTWRHLP